MIFFAISRSFSGASPPRYAFAFSITTRPRSRIREAPARFTPCEAIPLSSPQPTAICVSPPLPSPPYHANGNRADGLGRSIFDPEPDLLAREIEEVAKSIRDDEFGPGPKNLAGYGFLSLESGRGRDGSAIWMYYGRNNSSHAHADRLNIGFYAFGFDLSPDLGYPEFATRWPKRTQWTRTTLSHNTVLVNEREQKGSWSGHPAFVKVLPGFQASEVASPRAYEETRDYRRTIAFFETGPGAGYGLDIFRVEGGDHHLRSFHGPGALLKTDGLTLERQESGTLAGPDTEFGSATVLPDRFRIGYSWLKNIERDTAAPPAWRAEWPVPAGYRGAIEGNGVHLRLWDFSHADEVILADGEPPQNKPGNPRFLRYALAQRSGQDITSTFVSLIEPYQHEPIIASARRLFPDRTDAHRGPVILEVRLADGAIDTLIYTPDESSSVVFEQITSDGRLAFFRMRKGAVERAALIAGRELRVGSFLLTADRPHHSGRVTRIDPAENGVSTFWVDVPLPDDGSLDGEQIVIQNDGARNAAYTIQGVQRDGTRSRISIGATTLVRGFMDEDDYQRGVVLNFREGDRFVIPAHAVFP